MKIYTKVVIDMETLETVEEESFEYEGPIAECGGSGGGSSGEIGYPQYLETFHSAYLGDASQLAYSLRELVDAASNPYTGENAYDPSTPTAAMLTAADNFSTSIGNLPAFTAIYGGGDTGKDALIDTVTLSTPSPNASNDISSLWTDPSPAASDEISTSVDAFGDVMDDEINNKVLPRFAGGMRDINAVMSSSYAVGAGIIEGMRNRDVAHYQGELRIKAYLLRDEILAKNISEENNRRSDAVIQDDAIAAKNTDLKNQLQVQLELSERELAMGLSKLYAEYELGELDARKALMHYSIEANRLKIIALKEQLDKNIELDVNEAEWLLKVTRYINDGIASIAGASGTYIPDKSQPSALGMALAGAGTGAMIGGSTGNPIAAGIGAGVGAAVGIVGSLI